MRGTAPAGRGSEPGFTLIELVITMAVLAALIAIAIPTYLGFRERSQDRAAQTTLRDAAKAAFVHALPDLEFSAAAPDLVSMQAINPGPSWSDGATSSTGPLSISAADAAGGDEMVLAVQSHSGACFYLRVSFLLPEQQHHVDPAATCRASDYLTGVGAGW